MEIEYIKEMARRVNSIYGDKNIMNAIHFNNIEVYKAYSELDNFILKGIYWRNSSKKVIIINGNIR